MSRERELINDGELCRHFNFTLAEVRGMDVMEKDVYARWMNLKAEVQERRQKKRNSGYGNT